MITDRIRRALFVALVVPLTLAANFLEGPR